MAIGHFAEIGARWPRAGFLMKNACLDEHCAVAMATVGTIFEPDVVMGCGHLLTSSAGARSKNYFDDDDIIGHFSKLSKLIFLIFKKNYVDNKGEHFRIIAVS